MKEKILKLLPSDMEIEYDNIVWLLNCLYVPQDNNLETYKHDLFLERAPPDVKYPLDC